MKTYYACPYQDHKSCDKIYPDGTLQLECIECGHYVDYNNSKIRETGSFPLLEWILNLFKSK